MVALRYGAKPIEVAKGKNAVEAGGLDAQIEQASGALRAGFAKKM
jgi:2,3-bisphosphoglycerate-independent phosphoglycerate mutase